MSSPTSRRSKRGSAAGTPTRPSRNSNAPSSPAARSNAQSTPRASRQTAVAASSPLFHQSNPSSSANNSQRGSAQPEAPSSDAGDRTPRGRRIVAPGESSPIHYDSTSSPTRSTANGHRGSESSALFMRSGASNGNGARSLGGVNHTGRSDIHSDVFGAAPGRRNRIFVDENGMPAGDGDGGPDRGGGGGGSEATFSNLNPNTSEAEAMAGSNTKLIWGTNISVNDTMARFKDFLYGFQKKYRMWADGATEEETTAAGPDADAKEYVELMDNMLSLGASGFNLDVRNLKAYPSTVKLWYQVQAYPHEVIPIMDQCIKDVMVELAEKEMRRLAEQSRAGNGNSNDRLRRQRDGSSVPVDPSSDAANGAADAGSSANGVGNGVANNVPDLVAEVEMKPYKVKPFGLDETINLRDLNPNDIDKMVAIKGLVIRTTPIIPDMKIAFFRCSVCGYTTQVALDRGKISEPTRCPREICQTPNSMQIVHNRCQFADKQVIKLQETPDSVPDGQTPHSVSLCAYDELVDVCKAGDRVEITGIFRSNPVRLNPRQRTIKALFKTYLDVLFVQKVDKRRMGVDVSTIEQELAEEVAGSAEQVRKVGEEEEARIRATAARPDVYELLSRSLAPSIYEMDDVKKGLLLQLFGGTNKSFEKGGSPKYRGDINVLLCGDPSTAKSQILQYVHKIAPRGVYTSGKGSSAVGLTAYVSRDPETRSLVLESGALVLSDGGICCIDEFDKMSDSTRSVLHEVMEQQTISIAKAGIITTLNARTSILASANPIGSKYNPNLPVPQNIDLPPTLLSRFDLVYLVLDRVDEQNDRRMARHLVGMYLDDRPDHASSEFEIMPVEFLTAYISYARQHCQPKITQAASDELVRAYVEMRKLGEDARAAERRITATTRQLESMIRLSEAHARMRLSAEVLASDVQESVRLIKSALKQAATDARTGLIDMGLLTDGTSAGERRRKQDLKKAVLDVLDTAAAAGAGSGGSVRWTDVHRRLSEQSSEPVDAADFNEAVRALELDGSLNVSGDGPRRTIRRVTGIL